MGNVSFLKINAEPPQKSLTNFGVIFKHIFFQVELVVGDLPVGHEHALQLPGRTRPRRTP